MAECRVLIVEDETIVAMDLSATLRRLGCEVVATVDNGEAAIEAAGRHEPQLVLMDIRLKGAMDGIEAARTIHQRYGTPVVFLTAHGDTSTVDRSMGSAPYGYLVKPFDEGDLQRVISVGRVLARAMRERQPALRVIYMSGYTDNAISDQGVLEPGVRFVEKPVATNVLLRTIRTALDEPPSNAV